MHWLRLILAAVLASELLLRLPLPETIRRANGAARKSARLLQSRRISDHWKEKMLPAYAMTIAANSLLFFALLCVVVLPVVLIGFSDPGGMGGWLAALVQPVNIAVLCAVSILYVILRSRLRRG